RRLEAAHARTIERGLEAQPKRIAGAGRARDVKARRDQVWLHRIALATEQQRVDRELQIQLAGLAGCEAQPPEIERVGAERHEHEVSVRATRSSGVRRG